MNIEPTVTMKNMKTEGATKMYQDKDDLLKNGNMNFIVIDQNDEDTLLQKVIVDDEGNIKEKINYFVVAWGLQKDGSWNQGHYYNDEKSAKDSFKNRAKDRLTEGVNEDPFLVKARENVTAKKIMSVCNEYGYRCTVPYITSYGYLDISFQPRDRYASDIYWKKVRNGEFLEGNFTINTSSFGSLKLDEYREFLSCCEKAYKLCEELERIDLTTLERESE